MKLKSTLFIAIIFSVFANSQNGDQEIKKGREIIKLFQEEIFEKVKLDEEYLKKTKEEFQSYYYEDVLPRLSNISKNVLDDAIHWVDLNFDEEPELVFWTEGLSPSAWGAKEFLFVISIDSGKIKNSQIIRSIELDMVSRTANEYRYSCFMNDPNKGEGFNDFVGSVLSYANFGASGSTIYNVELGYNRYEEKIYHNIFTTSFKICK